VRLTTRSRIVQDEKGVTNSTMLLVFIPLLVAGILLITEHPRMLHGADIDLGQAVAEATRSAAMCVDETSQANGQPRIDPVRANQTFRRVLARNLGLNEVDLSPLPGSGMKVAPAFVLVVYNGDDAFGLGSKEFSDSNAAGTEIPGNGFPQEFGLAEGNIVYGPGTRSVVLDSPGCVAVVRDSIKPIFSHDTEAVRWASAKIVTR